MKSRAGWSLCLFAVLFTVSLSTITVQGAPIPAGPDIGLTTDVPSPQPVTATVTFTATSWGEGRNTEYAYFVQAPSSSAWKKMRNFRSNASWSWNTSGFRPGTYGIAVEAKNPGSAPTRKVATFTLAQPPAPSAITVNASFSGEPSSSETAAFTATAEGGTGNYEYAFHLQKSGSSAWDKKRGYSESPEWSPPSDLPPAVYCVCVYARTKGTAPQKGFDAYKTATFTVTADHTIAGFTSPPAIAVSARSGNGAHQQRSSTYALLQHL